MSTQSGKSLYQIRSNNVLKTWLFMSLFIAIFAGLGLVLAYYYQNVNIFYIALIFSIAMNIFSYWYSDKVALSMSHAREITKNDYTEFWNVAENLSIAGGIAMPRLYVIDDPIPNAFATGRNEKHSAIAATTGLLSMLSKSELEGVVAHEISHIRNKDILIATIVVIMVSAISMLVHIFSFSSHGEKRESGGLLTIISILAIILAPIAATIIQLAISRKREFLADASGAILTRYPEGLASALQKISQFKQPLINAKEATAHLYIVNPFGLSFQGDNEEEKISWISRLFMTHPPTNERIKALLNIQ